MSNNVPDVGDELVLHWPTEYRVVTQEFGANPQNYEKWGLPGHEGIDGRALMGSKIFAAAAGVVVAVGWKNRDHAYGYAIRTRTRAGGRLYELVYAHLKQDSAVVKMGDVVEAGALLALADNTGRSSAAHLHLTLRDLALRDKNWGTVIDPTPFFIDWPIKRK